MKVRLLSAIVALFLAAGGSLCAEDLVLLVQGVQIEGKAALDADKVHAVMTRDAEGRIHREAEPRFFMYGPVEALPEGASILWSVELIVRPNSPKFQSRLILGKESVEVGGSVRRLDDDVYEIQLRYAARYEAAPPVKSEYGVKTEEPVYVYQKGHFAFVESFGQYVGSGQQSGTTSSLCVAILREAPSQDTD